MNIKEVISMFDVMSEASPYGDGHINDTFVTETNSPKYILQRINNSIFPDVEGLMNNIEYVTEYLKGIIEKEGGDTNRETLSVIKTRDGKNYYKTEDGKYFRMYRFIDDTVTYQSIEKEEQFYSCAKAFGKFQKQLAGFDVSKLVEIIPDFHNTPKRVEALKKAIADDIKGRKKSVEKEIKFALDMAKYADVVTKLLGTDEVPLRVTHNDTKLNNVLFDKDTDEAICVIDLDTVMPGSLLYDFGDSIRFGAATAKEDETDLSKMHFDISLFKAYAKGFLEELGDDITAKERELIPYSALLMTYECGIRFLTDYLNGDTYFKIKREHHNLDRCRTQFKLVYEMEQQLSDMAKVIEAL